MKDSDPYTLACLWCGERVYIDPAGYPAAALRRTTVGRPSRWRVGE